MTYTLRGFLSAVTAAASWLFFFFTTFWRPKLYLKQKIHADPHPSVPKLPYNSVLPCKLWHRYGQPSAIMYNPSNHWASPLVLLASAFLFRSELLLWTDPPPSLHQMGLTVTCRMWECTHTAPHGWKSPILNEQLGYLFTTLHSHSLFPQTVWFWNSLQNIMPQYVLHIRLCRYALPTWNRHYCHLSAFCHRKWNEHTMTVYSRSRICSVANHWVFVSALPGILWSH